MTAAREAELLAEVRHLRKLISATHKNAVKHTSNCETPSCHICDGGLFVCADCGAAEIETEERICTGAALATTAGEANVIAEIAAERRRQVEVEGWTAEHDDEHVDGSLATVAAAYADKNRQMTTFSTEGYDGAYRDHPIPKCWPRSWQPSWWKPSTTRRDLIKAGALIVAEIERLDRAALVADKG